MVQESEIKHLIAEHGTPLFVVDHDGNPPQLRRIQTAAAPRPGLLRRQGQSRSGHRADALRGGRQASTSPRCPSSRSSTRTSRACRPKQRQDFIWDKIIYANPIKANETLRDLDPYKPLVTYDNFAEIGKIRRYAPHAGLALRLSVPNTGAMVELSSKFGAASGEAVALIEAAHQAGLVVEGISFHVGSQTTNFENYVQAINLAAGVFREAADRGFKLKLLDIGGGFPAPYNSQVQPFETLARRINRRVGPALSRRKSKFSPSRAGSWWPPPARPSPR